MRDSYNRKGIFKFMGEVEKRLEYGSDEYIRDMYKMFPNMAEVLEEKEGERFSLKKFIVTEKDVCRAKSFDFRGEYSEFIPGEYIKLVDKGGGGIVMSDTPMEKSTNRKFYHHANGDVLVGGLGLGMILLAAQDKPEVKSITVIELHQEVINLVAEQLPLNDKVSIICDDIRTWKPGKGVKYDTVYFDIWNVVCGDFWEEHVKLHRKFAQRLNRNNPNYWMNSWRKYDFKRESVSWRG